MGSLSLDTHPDAEWVQIDLFRQMPSWRKLQLVDQMTQTCYTLALSGLRQRYPTATPEELRLRLASLVLGREVASRAYGDLPE
jgi:hypothetical protein